MRSRLVRTIPAAILALLLLPGLVAAHPLGNFTINHFARVTVERGSIAVRWVLDMAEIPAFTEIRTMDADGNSLPDATEQAAWLDATLPLLLSALELTVDGSPVPLRVEQRELTFPPGQGGLSTLRLTLELRADSVTGSRSASFADRTYPERIGWREIVVQAGAAMRLTASDVPSMGISDELRKYPADAVTEPLAISTANFRFAPDASGGGPPSGSGTGSLQPVAEDPLAAIVGGDLTPVSAALALLLALGLGALHGISPGHGKTLVAGYLIGSRGTLRQAVWLGVTVALSHTVGVMVLGAITLGASALILPEQVIGWLTLGSALLVIGLGAALLRSLLRARGALHEHDHPNPHPHPHASAPASAPTLSTRAVAGLGLAGGMVPSASALLVLLVAVSLQRFVFGLVLVVAFGVGMAAVLAGISASVVFLRGRVAARAGWWRRQPVARIARLVPLASAVLVVAVGVALTIGAAANLV